MDNFDLKRFLVENKITQNSKLHEAPHLDFDAIEKPSEFKEPSNTVDTKPSPSTSPSPSPSNVSPSGKTNLTVGDIITKDMLRHPNNSIFNLWGPAKILKVFTFPNSTQGRVVVKFNKDGIDPSYDPTIEPSDYNFTQGHYIYSYKISGMNNYTLKPPYRIVLPSSVSTPKSFSPSEPRQNTFSPLEETLNNFDLKKFLVENKITRNSKLFEADDFEFTDLDKKLADKMSNEVELQVGDTITPDMWDKQAFEYEDGDLSNYNTTIQDSYLIKDMRYDEGDDEAGADWLVDLRSVTTGKNFGITGTPEELTFLNILLKDNYRIITPDMNESDDFEFTDIDKKLAKGLSSSYIIIELINEYTFSEGGDGITLYEVKTIETTTSDLAEILQLDIPYDKNSLETLLKDQYFENDDLMDFLNEGEITQAIPDEYYGDDWDIEWEDFDIKVILS
jgi:hypothetical protein